MLPWLIPAIIAGLGAAGDIFGNRKSARTAESSSISDLFGTESTGVDITESPELSPELQNLFSLLSGGLGNLLQRSTEDQFLTSGILAANKVGSARNKVLDSVLAARGLGYSPAGANAMLGSENMRLSDILSAYTQAPILAQNQQLQALNAGTNLARSIPYATRRTGTTTSNYNRKGTMTGTNVQPGSALGSGLGSAGTLLGLLYGMGAFGAGNKTNSILGDANM